MGIITNIKNKLNTPVASPNFRIYTKAPDIKESFKGEVIRNEVRFPSDIGEDHPFDFSVTEGLYVKFPLITGIIDKYVDYILGAGFYIESESEKAKEIINQFMEDVNFDSHLRKWIKQALIDGTSFLELGLDKSIGISGVKVLDSKWMYVKRSKYGETELFNQLKFDKRGMNNTFKLGDFISFKPNQIAMLTFNVLGDCPYGYGIIYPVQSTINHFLSAQANMHMLLERKAGSPYHIKMGDLSKGINPPPSAISAMRADLEVLTNRHEWVTGPEIDIKAIDFGNISQKFEFVLNNDEDHIIFGTQVPEVLLGRGNIAEGLATEQKEGFNRNIGSKRQEIEKIIEQNIFKVVLLAHGLDVHVEFEWGQPSESEQKEKVAQLLQIIGSSFTSPGMKQAAEKQLINVMNFNELEIQEANEEAQAMMDEETEVGDEEKDQEKERQQPLVPGQPPSKGRSKDRFKESLDIQKQNFYEKIHIEESQLNEDHTLQEWIGFNYRDYLRSILSAIESDPFTMLQALSNEELSAGYLTTPQVEKVRSILSEGISQHKSMGQITTEIKRDVNLKDLYKMQSGKVLKNEQGQPYLAMRGESRASAIARTEITRLSNIGLLDHYGETGAQRVRFIATLSARTCEICESFNGQVFDIDESYDIIPEQTHPFCRCSFIVVS